MEIANVTRTRAIPRIAANIAAATRGTIHDDEFYIVASGLVDVITTEIVSCRTEICLVCERGKEKPVIKIEKSKKPL